MKDLFIYTYIHTYIHTCIHYITLHYITLQYSTVQYSTVQYSTVQYITLHYITLHYITLHYNTYIHTYVYIYIYIIFETIRKNPDQEVSGAGEKPYASAVSESLRGYILEFRAQRAKITSKDKILIIKVSEPKPTTRPYFRHFL